MMVEDFHRESQHHKLYLKYSKLTITWGGGAAHNFHQTGKSKHLRLDSLHLLAYVTQSL